MPRKGQEGGDIILSPKEQQTSQAQWMNDEAEKRDETSRNGDDLLVKNGGGNTLQQPTTPIMPKKVSFAAEVDEQQERINKENMRRDACCTIQ